jgi:hypothetical protein
MNSRVPTIQQFGISLPSRAFNDLPAVSRATRPTFIDQYFLRTEFSTQNIDRFIDGNKISCMLIELSTTVRTAIKKTQLIKSATKPRINPTSISINPTSISNFV